MIEHLSAALCVLFASLLLGQSSCAQMPDVPPGRTLDASDRTAPEGDLKAPFMIGEARLPQGFPPPGPVGQVILKQYPAYRAAQVKSADGRQTANKMFRPLFNHIKKNHIAMTAPVEMTYQPQAAGPETRPVSMAFLYGNPGMGQLAEQGDVQVIDLPAQTVVSVTVRGGYEKAFSKGIQQLHGWLAENPGRYEVVGPPRFLGYNSPFVPSFLRIGEAQLPVKPAKEDAPAPQ